MVGGGSNRAFPFYPSGANGVRLVNLSWLLLGRGFDSLRLHQINLKELDNLTHWTS